MTKSKSDLLLIAIIACLVFICGALLAIDMKQMKQANTPSLNTVYQANFNNRKCDFCGVQLAEFYELSHSRKTGRIDTEYLCKECHQFLHYEQFLDTFTKKRVKK